MDIIAYENESVNIVQADSQLSRGILEIGKKWVEHKRQIPLMADKLSAIGQHARAARMRMCSDTIRYDYCPDCGKYHVERANLCRDRFCPVCSRRLALKRFAIMIQIVDELRKTFPDARWSFVTLTVKNCNPEYLTETINDMAKSWDKLARRKKFRETVAGWARSLEVTYNRRTRELHPHFHILVMWKEGRAPERGYISGTWLDLVKTFASPLAQNEQDIGSYNETPADDPEAVMGAVLETYKYSVKSADLKQMPLSDFQKLDAYIKGRRLVAFGGAIREKAAQLKAEAQMEVAGDDRDEEEIKACADCGSLALIHCVGKWLGDGYLWRVADRF